LNKSPSYFSLQLSNNRREDKVYDHVLSSETKYLGTTLTNQNDVHDEMKIRLNSGNACYYSVQNLLSSQLIKKNINLYKTVILPVVLYRCETWSLTLREEHGLKFFEDSVLRRIFGPKREEDGS
jgi:hypothetical protein